LIRPVRNSWTGTSAFLETEPGLDLLGVDLLLPIWKTLGVEFPLLDLFDEAVATAIVGRFGKTLSCPELDEMVASVLVESSCVVGELEDVIEHYGYDNLYVAESRRWNDIRHGWSQSSLIRAI